MLDQERTTDSLFVCKCDTAGSIDLIVIEQKVRVTKRQVFISFRSFSFADAAHYFSWETFKRYPQVFMAVFSIDFVWLLLVCLAKCRSNERRVSMKKSGNTDAFWRERRAARRGIKREGEKLAAKRGLIETYVPILTTSHVEKRRKRKRTKLEKQLIIYSKRVYYFFLLKALPWIKRKLCYKWWKGTYYQVRRQHKLFRTCYAKYHIDEDPSKFHTGAQKATVRDRRP